MSWQVEITAPAQADLTQIYSYIAETLKEPNSAVRIYKSIRAAVLSLSEMPERFGVIQESPYDEIGIRKMLVGKYILFYVADRQKQLVTVLRIVYNRREWHYLLGLE